ncbi:MAG: hypothetical protein WCP60_02045 [bacterium]
MMFEELEVLPPDESYDGPMQMALDEVLLRRVSKTTMRIYRWEAPCVSFGYFQKYTEVRFAHPSSPLVRRWTGGGMVEHGADLTFSLMVPREVAFGQYSPAQFYKILHRAFASAITRFTKLEIVMAGDREILTGPSCFSAPARDDLIWQGNKILGGAQRRSEGALLYQGSLQGCREISWGMREALLHEQLASALGNHVRESILSETMKQAALELAHHRYRSDEWNKRR